MTYTTTAEVRDEAGFTNNTDITDAMIDKYRTMAYNMIVGWVSSVYSISAMATNFTGSQAEGFLGACERLLGAGLLLSKEYGVDDETINEGYAKMKEAKSMMQCLFKTDLPLKLLDSNGNEYTKTGGGGRGNPVLTGVVDDTVLFTGDEKY